MALSLKKSLKSRQEQIEVVMSFAFFIDI